MILGTMLLLVYLLLNDSYTFTRSIVFVVLAVEVYYLYHHLDKSNREVISFLKGIQYDDFSHTYSKGSTASGINALHREFNEVIRKFREVRADKEAQHQYLKTIVQHVGIGIITFDKEGEVQIINGAAKKLLGINQLKNVANLRNVSPELVESFKELRTGGRDLIKINRDDDEVQLSAYAIELSLKEKEFKLVSIQNIQSELEEKEMEAWQNLIRVLTHEIMNSVTPISSMAAMVESELREFIESEGDINEVTNEQIEEFHLAVSTIQRRSTSLIEFVSDFRNMTRIRLPQLAEESVLDILKHVVSLLKNDIEERGITLKMDVQPEDMMFNIDRDQIEQVVINLVKNAIQAVEENDEEEKKKILKIKAWNNGKGDSFISIEDNGMGIEEEALKKIFIPFFTTKKSGSGIGLSLSKQIMRNHEGAITVKSVKNIGTEFLLKFVA